MKNLSNCENREFLRQAMRMRAPLAAWLEATGIPELRKREAACGDDLSDEERLRARIAQGRKNCADIVAAALEKDFDGTVALLCMSCFVEPEDFDDHPLGDYLAALAEILGDRAVTDFFTLCL